jgi:hypothetical protein
LISPTETWYKNTSAQQRQEEKHDQGIRLSAGGREEKSLKPELNPASRRCHLLEALIHM